MSNCENECIECYCWAGESALEEAQPKPENKPPGRTWPSDGAEDYVQERRIQELMNLFMTKLLAHMPEQPIAFLIQLLDDLMLFRSGIRPPPYLYEDRHLKQLMKSFDPGETGWISSSQLMQARLTLGLKARRVPCCRSGEMIPVNEAEKLLRKELDEQMFQLISAGMEMVTDD